MYMFTTPKCQFIIKYKTSTRYTYTIKEYILMEIEQLKITELKSYCKNYLR